MRPGDTRAGARSEVSAIRWNPLEVVEVAAMQAMQAMRVTHTPTPRPGPRRTPRTPVVLTWSLVAFLVLGLAACAGGGSGGGDDRVITLWTIEDQNDRVAAQRRLVERFTEETGVEVQLQAIAENQLTTVLTSAAASNDLPDLIAAVTLSTVNQLKTDELLDTRTAAEVVEALGPETFSEQALRLTRSGDQQLAVPSDGYPLMLIYRQDLFEKAGLPPPTTFARLRRAAERLHDDDTVGIVASTTPNDIFTSQTFEFLALANGCDLVGAGGEIAIDSDACVDTFAYFSNLIDDYSVVGNQDVDTTRAAYFSGRAAMLIWSSFVLDEMAGLREDALPTCAQCRDNPAFLAENSGVVAELQGPGSDEPASYGEVVAFGILDGAHDRSGDLVEFMMSDGYRDWLAVAPEGKMPVRLGTPDEPRRYVEEWRTLEAGVDTKAPLADFYTPETLRLIEQSAESFTRWGYGDGHGELAGVLTGQLVVPRAVSTLVSGGGDPSAAAEEVAEEADTIRQDLP